MAAMSDPRAITQEIVQIRLEDAMRLFVGSGRRFSVNAVSAATGIPARTIKSYQQGEAVPGLGNLLRIFAVLPPEFAEMLLAEAGLCGVRPAEQVAPCGYKAMAQLSARIHRLSTAMKDGRINHQERPPLAMEMRTLAVEMGAFADGLERTE